MKLEILFSLEDLFALARGHGLASSLPLKHGLKKNKPVMVFVGDHSLGGRQRGENPDSSPLCHHVCVCLHSMTQGCLHL